jgi:hypothetical protein
MIIRINQTHMRKLFFIYISLIVLSCNNDKQKSTKETTATKDSAVADVKPPEQKLSKAEELPIVDTGQTWFRVKVTKNDTAFMDFEGSWQAFFETNNSATLQMTKSEKVMSVTDGLSIYMNGLSQGKMEIVPSNREKGTASMIFMPLKDGAYGLAITANEGTLDIMKLDNEFVSGKFEAKALDLDKNAFFIQGYFINAKINPEKIKDGIFK